MTAKESALKVLDQMPDKASWNDIMYELYVKQKIDSGLQAINEGRVVDGDEVLSRLKRKTITPT